jgi:hypothetical protein
MLFLSGTEPMQYVAVCDTCGSREGPMCGTREAALQRLLGLAWRLDDDKAPKTITCVECAGPPSVFPAAEIGSDPSLCKACGSGIGVCCVCHAAFGGHDVISCRGAFGHAHGRCATQKVRKFVPPE